MVETIAPKRVFRIKHNNETVNLTDPNEAFSVKDVVNHYSSMYPQITNFSANKQPFIEDDCLIYEIDSELGQHG